LNICILSISDIVLFVFVFRSIKMTRKSPSGASSPSSTVEGGAASAGRFVCSMCAKVYRSGAGLRYHKRKRHRGKLVISMFNKNKERNHTIL